VFPILGLEEHRYRYGEKWCDKCTNPKPPRKIPNTTRNTMGNLSGSWQYDRKVCALPTAFFLLACKRLQRCSAGYEKMFQGFLRGQNVGKHWHSKYVYLYTGWLKNLDSNFYVYISWTICGLWMIYIIFEREDPVFQISLLERSSSTEPFSSVSWEQYESMLHMICFRDLIKTESATAVQRAFRLRFNIQPPTRKDICHWNHQFEQILLSV